MRRFLLALSIMAIGLSVSAAEEDTSEKVWKGKAGECLDWSVTWKMRKVPATRADQPEQKYQGTLEQVHTGGACSPASGWKLSGTVLATIEGGNIAADVVQGKNDNACTYSGKVDGTAVKDGVQVCLSMKKQPWQMTIVR